MKFPRAYSIVEIAELCNAEIIGDDGIFLTGMNEIHKLEPGDLMFVDNEKYFTKSLNSIASAVLINKKITPPSGKTLLYHSVPFEAYNSLAWHFRPFIHLSENISSLAIIDPSCTIEPGVFVGPYARIGAGSYIQSNSYIGAYTEIGENVIIQPGCMIATDAFYFNKRKNDYYKWRSIGKVVIENNVELGAACTIQRGVSGSTTIGEGTKLDCQVHIGHGAVIGKNCLIAAQTALAGKVTIGNYVTIYGQVGIAQGLSVGDHAVLLAKTGVSKDLPGNQTYYGVPAQPVRDAYKQLAALRIFSRYKNNN